MLVTAGAAVVVAAGGVVARAGLWKLRRRWCLAPGWWQRWCWCPWSRLFTDKPDGIPGNDDTGTMSAWAVFNMIGFYPDCPGSPDYTLTTPVFDKVTIRLDPKWYKEKELIIETNRQKNGLLYINDVMLNGKKLNKYRISHDELVHGKVLKYNLR